MNYDRAEQKKYSHNDVTAQMFAFSRAFCDIGIKKIVVLFRIRRLFVQSESEYFQQRKSKNKEAEN